MCYSYRILNYMIPTTELATCNITSLLAKCSSRIQLHYVSSVLDECIDTIDYVTYIIYDE